METLSVLVVILVKERSESLCCGWACRLCQVFVKVVVVVRLRCLKPIGAGAAG